MERARSRELNPLCTTRGTTILPLVVVVLIVIGLFVLWLTSSDARTPASAGKPSPDVHEHETASDREPAALADTGTAEPIRQAVEAPAEIPIEDRFEVHVSTRVALMPSSKAVPRIRVEVGYGTSFQEGDPVLGTGTTDDAGEAVIVVPKRALDQVTLAGGARYWARVVEPGYQRRTNGVSRAPGGDPSRITVIAFAGNTLTGRVVDEALQPVRANVSSRYLHANGKLVRDAGGETDANGNFVLHCNKAARVTLVADAGNKGTGALAGVDVPRTEACEPLTIVVHGPGIVRGRVRDASGVPAAGLDLLVLVAELDDDDGSFVLPESRGTEIEVQGRGQSWRTLSTLATGSFEATGLRDDLYVVRARTSATSGYPILLTQSPISSNGAVLELTLSRPHIVVRVVDAAGASSPRKLDCDNIWSKREFETVRDKARVVVSAARDAASHLDPYYYFANGRDIGDSSYAFDVEPQREYTVCLIGGDLDFVAKNVVVPVNASRVEVELVAADVRPSGTLDVEPKLPAGTDPKSGLTIRVEDQSSGFPIVDKQVGGFSDRQRATLSIPAGTYTLVVEGTAVHDSHHGTVMWAREVGRAEMTVVVRAGEIIHVEPVLAIGARLRVKLEGEPNDDDRSAHQKRYPGATWGGPMDWSTLVEMRLTAPGRWPTPVRFGYDLGTTSAAGRHEWSRLVLGTEETSELLPSGSYTLEAHMPGGRVVSTPVTLVDGSTTAVTVVIR